MWASVSLRPGHRDRGRFPWGRVLQPGLSHHPSWAAGQLGSWAGWDWNCELHLPLSTGKCLKTLRFHYASECILKTSWSVLISTAECECLMIPQLFSICCTSLCGCATYRWPLPQVFFYCDVTMQEIVRKTWSSLKEIQRFLVSSKTSKVVFREKLIF